MELCGGTHVRTDRRHRFVPNPERGRDRGRHSPDRGESRATPWANGRGLRRHGRRKSFRRWPGRNRDLRRCPRLRRRQPRRWRPASTSARRISKNWTSKCAIGRKRMPRPPRQECRAGPLRSRTNWPRATEQLSESPACQDADGKLLQAVTDALKTRFDGPIFLAGEKEGRVALIASVPKALTSRYQAGKLIQETAPLVGGKGGGRPELAQGGGTDATKIDAALARAKAAPCLTTLKKARASPRR